jgi:hypothetical protein
MRILPFACFNHFAFTLARVWQCPNSPLLRAVFTLGSGFLGGYVMLSSSMIEGALRILLRPWWRTFESEC